MPAVRRASFPLLLLVGVVFVGGIGFGAVAALTSPRKEVAKGTTATETAPATEAQPTEPAATPTTTKTEPTRKAEPKPEPRPKPTTPKTEKKPDPPKPTEPKPKPTEPKVEAISYDKQVLPIFKAKCLTCHGDPQKKGGLDLKTLAAALKGGNSGDGAVPGKPDDSQIWVSLNDNSMPPPGSGKEKLTEAEKKLVKDWILSGAK